MHEDENKDEMLKSLNNTLEIEEQISKYLYNTNTLTQVQRAFKEADERINQNLWKKYILKIYN